MIWNNVDDCKKYFSDYVKNNGLNGKDFYQLLRFSLSGERNGPDLFKAIYCLGPEETSKRLMKFYNYIKTIK